MTRSDEFKAQLRREALAASDAVDALSEAIDKVTYAATAIAFYLPKDHPAQKQIHDLLTSLTNERTGLKETEKRRWAEYMEARTTIFSD